MSLRTIPALALTLLNAIQVQARNRNPEMIATNRKNLGNAILVHGHTDRGIHAHIFQGTEFAAS
jgi:hypothetical protein